VPLEGPEAADNRRQAPRRRELLVIQADRA
jgi:hypothetical protein